MPAHRRRKREPLMSAFVSALGKASRNALQPSHRGWNKPGLASGRSPDSRFNKANDLPGKPSQWLSSALASASRRLQLRGSGGFAPRFPAACFIALTTTRGYGQNPYAKHPASPDIRFIAGLEFHVNNVLEVEWNRGNSPRRTTAMMDCTRSFLIDPLLPAARRRNSPKQTGCA